MFNFYVLNSTKSILNSIFQIFAKKNIIFLSGNYFLNYHYEQKNTKGFLENNIMTFCLLFVNEIL
jgi:hypothetical protein